MASPSERFDIERKVKKGGTGSNDARGVIIGNGGLAEPGDQDLPEAWADHV